MTQNIISVKYLHRRVTNVILTNVFEAFGPIKHVKTDNKKFCLKSNIFFENFKIGVYDDPSYSGDKCAEITYETAEQAATAVKSMHGKEILQKTVSVELKQSKAITIVRMLVFHENFQHIICNSTYYLYF